MTLNMPGRIISAAGMGISPETMKAGRILPAGFCFHSWT
jgi:hypothetical protein